MTRFGARFRLRDEIEALFKRFRSNADGVFVPTRELQIVERGNGYFGVAYVQPSRRVMRLLSAHREILLLISTFHDQQPRTTQLAIDLIDDAEGRLENTLALIIHRDPQGNAKLKNWGREQGLTVVPLFVREDKIPSGEELERTLFSEFYSHDPFDVTGPVFEDAQFYGRRDEAQDLARQLQSGQVRSALGIRKIGKTSIINRVLYVAEDYHASTA